MNQKSLIAVLGVVVVILIGTTVYFATINKTSQSVASAPRVVQQPVQTPIVQQSVQPTSESAKPAFDKKVLQDAAFSAVDNAMKAKYEKTKDSGYAKWGNKVDITSVDASLKAAKGKWYDTVMGDWDWIAWQQDDSSWKVLLSFDGFSCTELKGVPSQYDKFFQDVVYFRDTKTFEYKKQNCY